MAGMRLFGRRCALATDDFLFIGILHFIIFFPWLAWIPLIYASFLKHRASCNEDILLLLDISLPGLCVLFFLNWVISALFIIFSAKGTIAKPEPRRHVVTLVYIKLAVSVLDIAWASLGTVILSKNSYCDISGVGLVLKACTIFQWVATIFRLTMIIIFYDWDFSEKTKECDTKEYFTTPLRRSAIKKWRFRLQSILLMCTTATEERKQAFQTASELMALLSYDLDLVASDVIAGFVILRKKGIRLWETEKKALLDVHPITTSDGRKLEKFPPDDFEPWMNLQAASHYFKLGMGVFGWFWFVFKNLTCGCCILCRRLTCCFPFRKKASIVEGDNCCGCDLAGLQLATDLVYEDLVFVSFKGSVYEIPFFVTLDHETSSVLITARGSMSMDDFLTDVSATLVGMDDPGCPSGAVAHAGMLNAARQVKKKLDDKNILEEAFKERPHYTLVTTGHSLGAAVATLLTLLYKHQYNTVRCYASAPPPVLNKAVLPYLEKDVFTVVFGNDVAGCITYETLKKVVIELVESLKECNYPKYKIFMCNKNLYKDVESAKHCYNSINDTSATNGRSIIQNGANTSDHSIINSGSLSQSLVTETCYLAGKILHIYPSENGYRLKITRPEDYKKIIFRPKMVLDHVPIYLEKALEDLSYSEVLDASSLRTTSK